MSASAMAKRLEGKTILITGASAGIGKATAFEFSRTQPNIRLILTARRIESLEAVSAEIRKESSNATSVLPVKLDISNPSEVRAFVPSLPDGWSNIDVLVNNAGGVRGLEKVGEIAEADVDTMISTNVVGLIGLTQQILPLFHARGSRGDIVNIGSIAGREPYAGGSIYCATKAAVRSFSDALRKENMANRIRVMVIDPGQVETEFSIVRFRGDQEKAKKVYEGCDPLTPEDIAEVVVWVVGRRENVVIADTLVFPSHQAGAGAMHRRT